MQLHSRNKILNLTVPCVMGILNITPDSFSDGGKYTHYDRALRHAQSMIESGATIIDIGGESTRPGATEISYDEELNRIIPIIKGLLRYFDVWISVDTSKAEVIREVSRAGVHIINDVRALREPGAMEAAIESQLPVCLMHMKDTPATMQLSPYYENVLQEVTVFFEQQIMRCVSAGMKREKIILDPGFGFGKAIMHNYYLLAHLNTFCQFELPILVGMSKKSMIGQLLNVPLDKRLAGSLACAAVAVMQGANIIRVHDVQETIDAVRVVEAVLAMKG